MAFSGDGRPNSLTETYAEGVDVLITELQTEVVAISSQVQGVPPFVGRYTIDTHHNPAYAAGYHARIGLMDPAGHKVNGYRRFTAFDASRLGFNRTRKSLGFARNEIWEIRRQSERGESLCRGEGRIIRRRIRENRAKRDDMLPPQTRMARALARCEEMPDGVQDGHGVFHLIDFFEHDKGPPGEPAQNHCERHD